MNSFEEIYKKVDSGNRVFWKNASYEVKLDASGYVITHISGGMVGLYEPDYTPTDFYIIQ